MTNRDDQSPETQTLGSYTAFDYPSESLSFEPGQELGGFKLGSTVVLVFQGPESFRFSVQPGDRVYMGQSLGE
jgi:phosphatidylserine decarboxylase